jgi:choline-sulfatase
MAHNNNSGSSQWPIWMPKRWTSRSQIPTLRSRNPAQPEPRHSATNTLDHCPKCRHKQPADALLKRDLLERIISEAGINLVNTEAKKNVLLISLDDAVAFWKYKSLFGEVLQTPNLDRICGQSTSFHSAYCQAPVCSPSRASFMSGLSPHQTGVTHSDPHYFDKVASEKMWPSRLKHHGYHCVPGGKVMRGYRALPQEVHEAIYSTPYSDSHGQFSLARRKSRYANGKVPDHMEFGGHMGGRATTTEDAEHNLYDNQVAEDAISFLKTYDGQLPFYREVGFQSPHGPWVTPRQFKEMYHFKAIRQPKDWARGFDVETPPTDLVRENIDSSRERFWRQSVRNYFSAISYADEQIGRVWDTLKASSHAANTLVVILSDHGMHLGERN